MGWWSSTSSWGCSVWVSRDYFINKHSEVVQLTASLNMALERIKSLETQVEKWESLWQKAEKRADNAIDELLAVRGIPPVSVPSPQPDPEVRSPFTEDPDERARILKQYESLGPEVLVQEATQ